MKNEWKPARELFELERIDGYVIFRHASSGSLLCHNEKTDELFHCATGHPPAKFDLYEATDWVAGTANQYEFKVVKEEAGS